MGILLDQDGVVMGADSKGHATLSCTTCSFNIGNLDVHFSGGAAWLYNLFSDDIADSLKDSLRGQVRQTSILSSPLSLLISHES